jgi:hypothetical protein
MSEAPGSTPEPTLIEQGEANVAEQVHARVTLVHEPDATRLGAAFAEKDFPAAFALGQNICQFVLRAVEPVNVAGTPR